MYKTLQIFNDQYIAYKELKSNKNLPPIIFLHGLLSNMEASKALYLDKFCLEHDLSFIRYDALGHGNSSGIFTDYSIASWYDSAVLLLQKLSPDGAILVGSSMGGWIAILLAIYHPELVKGIITISPSLDFTQEIYQSLNKEQKNTIDNGGIIDFVVDKYSYEISSKLIKESENYLLLDKPILKSTCPIHILHGLEDHAVNYTKSLSILNKLNSEEAFCTIVKKGDHSLSKSHEMSLMSKILLNFLKL